MPAPKIEPEERLEELWSRLGDAEYNIRMARGSFLNNNAYHLGNLKADIKTLRQKITDHIENHSEK